MPMVLVPPTERAALPRQLATLGQTRRRVAVAAGVFAVLAIVFGTTLVFCVLDAWLHLPPLVRGGGLVGMLVAAGVVALRWVMRPLRLSTDALAIALELEDRYPRLNDALASAVCFLDDQSEDRGVSRRLRAAAVRRAERMSERYDLNTVVPTGRCWKAFGVFLVIASVATPLGFTNTDRTSTALVRFADPFGNHPWPSKTRIEILVPEAFPGRLPMGSPFEVKFLVRGVIPDQATVTYRIIGGSEFDRPYPLSAGVDPKYPGAAVVTAQTEPGQLASNFQFRIQANDADTGWQSVAVVPPPRLVPLDGRASPLIYTEPPAYTGLPPQDMPDGAAVIEIPTGTRITIRSASNVRLSSATMIYQGDRSAVERGRLLAQVGLLNPASAFGSHLLSQQIGADIPMNLTSDGKVLSATFTPTMSGLYYVQMVDETGVPGTRPLEIRLTSDPAPIVSLLRPSAGRDPQILVPEASVVVHVVAEDRIFALRRVFLEYRVGKEGLVHEILLSDARIVWNTTPAAVGFAVTARPQPVRYEASYTVPMVTFLRDDGTPVRPGDVVYLRAASDDWDDITVLKEPGRSGEFEIRIATREAIDAFLQKELAAIRPELMRLRDQQRDAQKKTSEALPTPEGILAPADREKLQSAEQSQRQIRGKMADPRDGLRTRADMLRELVQSNNLPKSVTTDRVEAVADELDRLTDRDLTAVEPLITEARQQAAQPPKAGQEKVLPGLLTRIGRHQKSVDDGLSNLIDLLSQWGGAGEIRGEARVLKDNVLREAANTDKLPEKVPPGKAPETLTPGQRAELDRAAGKIDPLAEQASGLLGKAAKLAAEKDKQAAEARAAADALEKQAAETKANAAKLVPGSADRKALEGKVNELKAEADALRAAADKASAEAAALRKAITAAGGQGLPDDLRKAADALRNNRQTEAGALERSAAARLDRLANELNEQPGESIPELAKNKWKKAADQLDEIAGKQDELRKKVDAANRITDPGQRATELQKLVPQQQKLLDQTRELVQRLTRERAEDAAKDARAALDKMETARDDLERGMNPSDAQKDAVERLDEARDKLDTAAAKAPKELTDEKRRLLADKVKAVYERQKAAAAEAARIQAKVLAEKKWDRPLLTSYADLEDRERALAVEVLALGEKEFAELPVFSRVLKDAAAAMEKTADKAKERRQDAIDADAGAVFDADLEKLNDSKIRRPLDLATRRLEQLLDALKPDEPKKGKDGAKPAPKQPGGMPMMPPGANPQGNSDAVPPLAQLKTLRALQAELNERTAEFARLHPDASKLTDEERDELKELEEAQREMTSLFEQVAQLFQQQPAKPEPPAPEKQ